MSALLLLVGEIALVGMEHATCVVIVVERIMHLCMH